MWNLTKHAVGGCVLSTVFASTAFAGNSGYAPQAPGLLPSNSSAGECYAQVKIPAQYGQQAMDVVVEDAHTRLQLTEPQIRSRQEKVMVKEPSVRFEVRQPTYRTVDEQIMVRPAYEKLAVSRPQFKTVAETINVSKPRLVWKKGNPAELRARGYKIHSTADGGRGGRGYRSTAEYGRAQSYGANARLCGPNCHVWCLVEEPAQSVTFNRRVVVAPAQVQKIPVEAQYRTIRKQVVADPGGVREIPVAGQYASVTVEEIVGKSEVREVKMRAKHASVTAQVLSQPERYEWRRVVCNPGTHPASAGQARTSQSYGRVTYGGTSYGAQSGTTYSNSSYSGHVYGGGGQKNTYQTQSVHPTLEEYATGGHKSETTTYTSSSSYRTGSDARSVQPESKFYSPHMGKRENPRYRNR